jgi:ADP-ribose pyrophosphatase
MITIWPKISEESQKIGWKVVVRKFFMMPDGKPAEYTTLGRIGTQNTAVIALTADNQVVVARQFRAGPERILDELPGGGVNQGEDPADGAIRELREETGYVSNERPTKLGIACTDAYSNETRNYYILRNCYSVGPPEPDEREFVEPALITIEQLQINAKTGQMSDSVAVLQAYELLQELLA